MPRTSTSAVWLAAFAATLGKMLRSVEAGRGRLRERHPAEEAPGPELFDQNAAGA